LLGSPMEIEFRLKLFFKNTVQFECLRARSSVG